MKAAPAIPLFGDAYLADTRHLSLEEHGAYIQLLIVAWRTPDCSLPDDDKRLSQILSIPPAKWRKLKPAIMAFWTLENDRWFQRRLLKERKFVDDKRAKNKEAAETRWHGQTVENKGSGSCERITERTSERICERNAPPPPLKKEEGNKPPSGGYAFDGQVIRLSLKHFAAWKKAYPDIDLMAALQSRDDWFANEADAKARERWFMSTSNHLANLQQKARATEREADGWNVMP